MMSELNLSQVLEANRSFVAHVEEESGQNVNMCYQCVKCSGGCPLAFYMDFPPSMIMRLLQNGMKEEVLNSRTIWTCASCSTCTTRCPRNIDVAKVMDTLRIMARRQGVTEKGDYMNKFNSTFLWTVKMFGRLFEGGLIVGLNTWTQRFFDSTEFVLPMLTRNKLKPFPHRIKGTAEMKKMFKNVERMEAEH
jgi:heterodisulfide reductase subunit C